MSFGISKKSYDYIIYALSQCPAIEKAGIFGSRAMGAYKNGSDIDLVIYGRNITPEVVNRLSVMLNEELPVPYYFDIVHYDSLRNGSLKSHIDKYGKIFYYREKNYSSSKN
ncbi:MAG: nucleotidyltransferase domain-containing protein [Caldicoprobacter oshimai]|nr:MAG: DNA polymerase III subunit beta [Caldicoprobacter oshimai]